MVVTTKVCNNTDSITAIHFKIKTTDRRGAKSSGQGTARAEKT